MDPGLSQNADPGSVFLLSHVNAVNEILLIPDQYSPLIYGGDE